jgi:MFS family permease
VALEGYGRLLRDHPSFRRLWLGELVSFLGDWFNLIAVYASVQALTDSASAVAAVMVAKTLPSFFVSPLVGPIVDRFDRRAILIFTDLGRMLAVGGLLLAHHAGSLLGVFAAVVAQVTLSGFVLPTRNAVLPRILPADLLSRANALGSGTWSVMLAVGAALGGLATAAIGITAALLVDMATFVVSLGLFLRLPRLPARAPEEAPEPAPFVEGLRYLARTPRVALLAASKPMMGLSTGVVGIVPIAAAGLSPDDHDLVTGILFSARGAGALLGTLGARALVPDDPWAMRRALTAGYLAMGLGWGLVAVSLAAGAGPAIGMLGFLASAAGSGSIWVFSSTLLQTEADRRYHGRVFAAEFGVMTLVFAGSSWLSGALVDLGWAPPAVFAAAAAAAGVGLAVWVRALASRARLAPST